MELPCSLSVYKYGFPPPPPPPSITIDLIDNVMDCKLMLTLGLPSSLTVDAQMPDFCFEGLCSVSDWMVPLCDPSRYLTSAKSGRT